MVRISVEEAERDLKAVLAQVAHGEEVVLVEQDRVVARLVPPQSREQYLASMKMFRNSLRVSGEPLSATVIKARQEERG
jgi:antitoxin (DNA-binding transcriptional repressor) of toxin-antitoxin stability system